jgi:hypothetical protein
VEAEEEIAAIVVVVGGRVDEVAEEEAGARRRRNEETFMLSRNDHKTNDTPVLRYFLENGACMTFADEAL